MINGCVGSMPLFTSIDGGSDSSLTDAQVLTDGGDADVQDINECLTGNGGCDTNATCTNTPSSLTCTCNPGYDGNGFTCMPRTLRDWQADAFIKSEQTGAFEYFGHAVSLSADGNTLAVGAESESTSAAGINPTQNSLAPLSGAVFVYRRTNNTWVQEAFIKASNPGRDDNFGHSVSLSADGNTLAVGAPFEDSINEGAENSGAAYVFRRNNDTWSQQEYLKPNDTGDGDFFGWSVSVSSDGETLAVGAMMEDGSGTGVNSASNDDAINSGAVYVFVHSNNTWSQDAYVKASNAGYEDRFGFAVSLSADGRNLAVGAIFEDSVATMAGAANEGAADSGAVYIFVRTSGSEWSQQAFVNSSNISNFGHAVSLSADGNTLAVGATRETRVADEISGAVYVFRRTNASWTEETFIKASNPAIYDWFGLSVSLSADGSTLAVGAYGEDSSTNGINGVSNEGAEDSGAVYIFTRMASSWSEEAFVKATDTGAADAFGWAVSLSADGTTLAVGAYHEDSAVTGVNATPNEGAMDSGAVYTYSAGS